MRDVVLLSLLLLLISLQTNHVAATDPGKFEGCLIAMIENATVPGRTPSGYIPADLTGDDGKPASNISEASGMTYYSCVRVCGSESHMTSWVDVGQQAGAWVLPSLAIIAQLPFGAHSSLDDWIAVVLTIGCPTLAAYSLVLTVLNGRWITRRFDGIQFGAASAALRCLRSLQQTPLRLGNKGLLASLVVLPLNDEYWKRLADSLDEQGSTWTIPVIISLGWVALAYLLTVTISFTRLQDVDVSVNGLAIGSAWCFLLTLVTGWLMVSPKCNARRNAKCLREANAIAHIAPEDDLVPSDLFGVCIEKNPCHTKHRALVLIEEPDSLLHDQMCSQPIYNYARFYSWSAIACQIHEYFRNAHFQWYNSCTVHGGKPDIQDVARNRSGTLRQVINYCEDKRLAPNSYFGGRGDDFALACVMAVWLQWGTIGAAIVAFIMTPTVGLGCRSLAYVVYGSLSTVICAMFIFSSWLAHWTVQANGAPPHMLGGASSPFTISTPSIHSDTTHFQQSPRAFLKICRYTSIWIRRLAKILASLNALGCYCNSSVIGLGASAAYNLILVRDGTAVMGNMRAGLAGSVALSLVCGFSFATFLRFLLKPKRISDPLSYT
ncbi:hypothetical protein DL96DRAFT_1683375 [Flagelloscypha sp. PMI_526]|nr:hypothetical protein DL96DRAFT_1683375 [Flagelloscypha sp. PMI_526]